MLEWREERHPDETSAALRRRLLSGLSGRVVEIGCGQGSAFEHYGPEVEAVLAVEPDPTARVAAAQHWGLTPLLRYSWAARNERSIGM